MTKPQRQQGRSKSPKATTRNSDGGSSSSSNSKTKSTKPLTVNHPPWGRSGSHNSSQQEHQQQQQQHRHHRNHHHHHYSPRSNQHNSSSSAVLFPPDPKETAQQVVDRIYASFGLSDKFPKDCQQQVKEILALDPCEHILPAGEDDHTENRVKNDTSGWVELVPSITPTMKKKKQLPNKKQSNNRSSSKQESQTQNKTNSVVMLKDLTHLPYITIDNDNSMDLDQAMYITTSKCPYATIITREESEELGKESFHESFITKRKTTTTNTSNDETKESILVSYALADGAYFVPAFSPLFEHALKRGGASFYLPGKAIPMLPRELSENMMSLNPNVNRRALVFDIYLDATTGHVMKSFYRYAVIHSQWKGTYREVSEYYVTTDMGKHHWIQDQPYRETVDLLRRVGKLRIDLAKNRDVVQYNRDDNGEAVTVDPTTGMLTFRTRTERYSSEQYNEQISLLCNSEGAKMLAFLDDLEEKIPGARDILHPIYRTQSGPRDDQTRTLVHIINNTLQVHRLDAQKWGWKQSDDDDFDKTSRTETLAVYLERIRNHTESIDGNQNPHLKQKWKRVLMVIDRQAQITNQAASFSASPEDGHHALKMTHYARFSSPMRELVGCFTHKGLFEAHTGDFSHHSLSPETDMELRDNVIRAARRAKEIQKRLGSMVFLHMLNTLFYQDLRVTLNQRKIYTGVVMGMDFSDQQKSRRVYVQLDEPHIQIKVYAEDLDYHYNCRYGPEDNNTYNRRGSTVCIIPMAGSFNYDVADERLPPKFRAGDPVSIRVGDYAQFYGQKSRSRWVFIMIPQQVEENEETLRQSLMRNSVIDVDLVKDLEELSQMSSFSENIDESETEISQVF